MPSGSENPYNRKYGAGRLSGDLMDQRIKEEHVDTDEVLKELGIPVNTVTSLLSRQIDVKKRTVVDTLTGEAETSYYVQTSMGEFTYEIEN